MVRHEAGEALGAIADPSVKEILRKYASDPCPEVSETCQIALGRVEWVENSGKDTNSPYDSVGMRDTLFKNYYSLIRSNSVCLNI